MVFMPVDTGLDLLCAAADEEPTFGHEAVRCMRLIGEVKPLAGTKAAGRKPRREKCAT